MRRTALVMLLPLALACRGAAPAPTPAPTPAPAASPDPIVSRVPFVTAVVGSSTRVDWRVPERDGQLSDSQLVALAPRIARLRAEPDTLRMDVTDSLFIGRLVRVLALDDAGAVLGEIRRYEFVLSGGINTQPNGAVRGVRAGTGAFAASISRRLPGEFRTRGPALVSVLVTDSTGAGERMLQIAKGSGVISGTVRDSAGRPVGGANVQAVRRVGTERVTLAQAFTDADGRYRLDSLPAGRASIMAFSRGHQLFIIELPLTEGERLQRDISLSPLRSPAVSPSPRP